MYSKGDTDMDHICVDISEEQYGFLQILTTALEGTATKHIIR